MIGARAAARRGAHPVLIGLLVLCAGWLIVQNAVLFALVAWAGPDSALTIGRALVRVGLAVFAHAWWLPLVALAALLVAAKGARPEQGREIRHGR